MTKKKKLYKTETDLTKQALWYLAMFYYNRQFLEWNQIEKMAIVLHKNGVVDNWNKTMRKRFEEMAKYLFQIAKIIKSDFKVATWKFIDEDFHYKTLGEMDGIHHESIYNSIALLSKNAQKCLRDKSFIDEYIISLKADTIDQVQFLKCNLELDLETKADIFQNLEILNKMSDTNPEDLFRQITVIQQLIYDSKRKQQRNERNRRKQTQEKVSLLNKFMDEPNSKIYLDKFLVSDSLVTRANASLARLSALREIVQDELVKIIVNQQIEELQMSLLFRKDSELIENLIIESEEIFQSNIMRSRKIKL